MKKLFYVRTNGYDMVISVDENNDCKYLTQNECFPNLPDEEEAKDFLREIDSVYDWEDDLTYEQLFEEFPPEIIAEIEMA